MMFNININIKNKKKVFLKSICVCTVLILFGISFAFWGQRKSNKFVETPHLIQKLNENDEKKILVFFKEGCPYCLAAKETIRGASQASHYPVYYVNTKSEDGKVLVKKFNIHYASTLTVIQAGKYINVAYADKVNGKYVALSENIQKVFGVKENE